MSISRVAVVGAGVLGVAAAREVAALLPGADITVFDKAERIAAHQSGHTSGIVDAGLDRTPGSPEAELARRGVELLVPFVSERGVPYRECGQLIIAQTADEADRLEEIFARAQENDVPGVRLLERREIREIEPAARGVLALYSPHTAVTDFAALTEALASDVRAAGGTFRFSTEVTGFDIMSNVVRLRGRTVVAGGGGEPTGSDSERDEGPDGAESGGDDLDDQVHEAPRTYHGKEAGGPVIDVGDELRSRFGEQDWFKQVENTLGDWTEKFSSSWSRGPNAGSPGRSPDEPRSSRESDSAPGARSESDASGSAGASGSSRASGADSRGAASAARREASEETLGSFDIVIVCAGLQADRLAESAGLATAPRIVPFTSDYYEIPAAVAGPETAIGPETAAGSEGKTGPEGKADSASAASPGAEAVRGIIGSVPDPGAPFAETGIVRAVNDSLILGPNTFVSMGREKYEKRGFDLGDVGATVRFKGFWKFAAQTARTAAHGVKTVVSRSAFIENVQKYVPGLDAERVIPGPRGVRAQAMTDEGALLDELALTTRGRLTVVRSVPKSAATSALAIAERIVDQALANHER